MRSPDNVLMGIALFLLAGVILYNVFMSKPDVSKETVTETTSEVTYKSSVVTTLTTTETDLANYKININTATEEELQTLSGIGPAKAQAIIEYRLTNGNFSSVDELINVKGIGEKTLAKFIDDITV